MRVRQQIAGAGVGNLTRPRAAVAVIAAAAAAAVSGLAAACGQAPARPAAATRPVTPSAATRPAAPPVGPHGGVDLTVLVLTDGTPAVEAIRQQLAAEGVPARVVNLRAHTGPAITRAFLARSLPGGGRAGNFDGVVLPGATAPGLSGAGQAALAWYERAFGVRQVDAYSPPGPGLGMSAPPAYGGLLSGPVFVTGAGAGAGFGYLRRSFPFAGGPAGPAPFGYLADPLPGGAATPLLTAAIPHSSRRGALVWQYAGQGRQQLGIGFGGSYFLTQFRYLAPGIVDWLTRGVHLGDWRSYLTVDYDDVLNADAQWSPAGHCTPGGGACPHGTPRTAPIRMTPADVTYAVRWQRQHHFRMEFLFNGGDSAQFRVRGRDPLLAALRPVAGDFYWVNHTFTHAYLGCVQDVRVKPWRCLTSGGHIVWAAGPGTVSYQILANLAWARQNGIPAEPGVLATGEYSGLKLLPQQPADNPSLLRATASDHIRWVALDASREPEMRPVGAALGVPRHPIDVGYDVDTVAGEVSEYNWYDTARKDGGSGLCQGSKVTACIRPLNPRTGWASYILPGQVQVVFAAVLANDPRPFFMHQSNLTGDRLAYPVMDDALSAYRAVYAASAPVVNLPLSGDGAALHDQQLWGRALRAGTVTAWADGRTVTVTGPPGTPVPVTVPAGSTAGSAAGPAFGGAYAGQRSGYVTLGSRPLTIALGSAPYSRR